MSDEKPVIDFTPPESREYLDRIAKAKSGAVPVGGAPMPKMPRLDQSPAGDRFTGVQRDKLLTPEQVANLEREGKFIPGVGSAYVANQPTTSPTDEVVNPPRPESGLRQETIEGLKNYAEVAKQVSPEETVNKVEKEITDFDFGEFGQRVQNLLSNKKRRELIEKRITDSISIEDLIIYQEVRQQVPIIPGKFTPTYRSVGGHEDLWIKRFMGTETGSEMYITNKYAMMNLCCGFYAINGKVLLDHRNNQGFIEEKQFWTKFDQILKYPTAILEDLSVNYVWFVRRVERALVIDDIKGF